MTALLVGLLVAVILGAMSAASRSRERASNEELRRYVIRREVRQ